MNAISEQCHFSRLAGRTQLPQVFTNNLDSCRCWSFHRS